MSAPHSVAPPRITLIDTPVDPLPYGKLSAPPRSRVTVRPTNLARQLESELWAARMGHCGKVQLISLATRADGLPNKFTFHREKHIDRILCDIGLTPTVHEPCIYSGLILGKRVLFMQQVDNFAISVLKS